MHLMRDYHIQNKCYLILDIPPKKNYGFNAEKMQLKFGIGLFYHIGYKTPRNVVIQKLRAYLTSTSCL